MSINSQTLAEVKSLEMRSRISAVEYLDRFSLFFNQALAFLAGCGLLLMVGLIVGNGLLRGIYRPIFGTNEIVGWACALSSAFGLGYTQINRGYVEIDTLVRHFPAQIRHLVMSVTLLSSTFFFGLVSWQIILYGINIAYNGNVSETLGVVYYPLVILAALGFIGLTLALLTDFLKHIFRGRCSDG